MSIQGQSDESEKGLERVPERSELNRCRIILANPSAYTRLVTRSLTGSDKYTAMTQNIAKR
jgi:hypothetical protein